MDVNKVFKHQIKGNMKAYMDEMLVKSITLKQHLKNLEEVCFFFSSQTLNKANSFQVCVRHQRRIFFCFLVSSKGI
jgi:hypothetical protein